MTQAELLAKRLQEVFLDGVWVANTNYKALIESVNWQQATQSVQGLNSIAMLTFHINYYTKGLLHAFKNNELTIKDTFSFDCPEIKSEQDWQNLVNEFITNAEKFVTLITNFNDDQLLKPFVEEKYGTNLRNIEGVIEHSYYHLGQISLIKKLVAAQT